MVWQFILYDKSILRSAVLEGVSKICVYLANPHITHLWETTRRYNSVSDFLNYSSRNIKQKCKKYETGG